MAEQTEQGEPGNFVSLFERSVLNEWDASLPATELSKDTTWSDLRPNQLLRLFGATVLPESLLFFIEQSIRWKVAYSNVHNALAIQKDGRLEIWRDYCSVPVAKCRILDDEHPQWCKLEWTASGNLLLSARCFGAVDAFDGTGAFCFTIPIPSADVTFNPLYSVASIASAPHTTDIAWSDRIWILQYDGSMRCYLAGRVSGYHPLSTVNVSGGSSSIAITSALLLRANAMLVAAYDPDIAVSNDQKAVSNRGISIWRITDAEPFMEEFGKASNELQATGTTQKKSFTLFQSSNKAYVLQIVVNSDETSAACLTSTGDVLAFRVPSLQVIKTWSLGDEISPHRVNGRFISGIGWWSQKELMLLYSTGFVATVSFDSDGTTSAVEKNYSAWAQLICASQGHVLLLEITGRPEKADTPKRNLYSYIGPLIRFPYALLKLAGQAFVGAPLTAAEPTNVEIEMIPCRYILHEMKAITPPELFKKKLIANNYEEALTIAETYCLNADRVYQEQWRKNAVTVDTVENFLVKVKLRKWVLDECLSQVPESLEACKKLLQVGLNLTENLSKLKVEMELKSKQQEIAARYRLLHYQRVLDDYEAMLSASTARSLEFDARYYGSIRNLSLYEWALVLARAADFSRLGVLFTRYGNRLFSIWLPLLSNIPETVAFEEYEHLLPKLGERPSWAIEKSDHKGDFIEEDRFANFVDLKKDDVNHVVKDKPPLREFLLSINSAADSDAAVIKKWYEFRAIEIERFTSLADLAHKFLEIAATNGIEDLIDLREDMGILRLLNYECALSTPVSYEKLKKMEPLETLKLLLKEAPKEVFVKRFEQWAVPFCVRREQRDEIPAKTLIWKYLVSTSHESLKIPLLLCNSFKSKTAWWRELIDLNSTDIIRMVADCLATCSDTNQIDSGFQLISYCPDSKNDGDAALVQSMEYHLTALHLLNLYGIAISYQKLQSIAGSDQESVMLLKRLVRCGTTSATTGGQKSERGSQRSEYATALGSQKSDYGSPKSEFLSSKTPISGRSTPEPTVRQWTTDDWRSLLKDMMQISRTVLPSINEQRCHELFVDGLLSSKSMDLINLASKFLVTTRDGSIPKKKSVDSKQVSAVDQSIDQKLSYDSAVDLIWEAAENYINEAIDAHDESLNYARKCLNLLENPPDKIVREREFIDALIILENFDVRDVPARLKMYKNPVRLIDEIFMRRPQAYEEYEKLQKLCKLLRVSIADRSEPNNLLIMCTRHSLIRKDPGPCLKFCREIVTSNCSSGWKICWDACGEFSNTNTFNPDIRQKLLIFCLSHCDAPHLEPIIRSLQNLKIEFLKKTLDTGKNFEHVPWIMSTWNGIKEKSISDQVKISEWKMEPIYLDPTNYAVDYESKKFDETGVALFNFLRYILLTEESDIGLLDEVLAAIGAKVLPWQAYLAVVAFIGIRNDEICEKGLRSIPISPQLAQLAMYIHSLRAIKKNTLSDMEFVKLLHADPQKLVKEMYAVLGQENNRLKSWTATLVDFPEGVDRDRFTSEEEYRKETIVGIALSSDEAAYNQALQLAEIYGLSPWEVSMSHMEFLFTESGMNASSLSEVIKTRRLLEKLAERRQESNERLKKNVYPLLNGVDHSILLLFYAVVSKLVSDEELNSVNAHRTNLKLLKQMAADVDYKKLITSESNALDLLLPYMNADNFPGFAKVATKIPNKNYTLEDVLCVWARKVFSETLQKAKVPVAFDRCKKVLEKLTSNTYVTFAEKSMEKLSTDQSKLEFVRLAIEFASQREKLAPSVETLKEWESFLK